MKKRTSATLFVLAAALAVAGLLQQEPLFANGVPSGGSMGAGGGGATVVSGPCFFDNGEGSLWEGQGTWVQTPGGRVNGSCHASLVSGPGVTQNTHVEFTGGTPFGPGPYTGVLTPSGNAELFTHF
jgi:hypothetical protein